LRTGWRISFVIAQRLWESLDGVRGTQGLRVIDTSIMPAIPSGNTNGPTMAMAWRAADIILRDAPPAAIDHPS
jgi:choline dehydrogenase-like flavoprotein